MTNEQIKIICFSAITITAMVITQSLSPIWILIGLLIIC
jgi:hypothetical protein